MLLNDLKIVSLGKDLESFAKHAGRSTVNVEDVKVSRFCFIVIVSKR